MDTSKVLKIPMEKFTIKHDVEVICKDCNTEFDMEEKNPEEESEG